MNQTKEINNNNNNENNLSLNLSKYLVPNDKNLDDTTSPLSTNNVTKKYLMSMMYLLSHLIFAIILTTCLKRTNPILLFLILSGIMGYISYDERNNIPMYTLLISGSLIYMLDLFTFSCKLQNSKNKSKMKIIISDIWKLPYYGIISYYIVLYTMFSLKN